MSDDRATEENEQTTDTDAGWSQAAQRHYEPNGEEELTTSIVFAIAETAGVSPSELKSTLLYNVIDAPALENTFFGPNTGNESRQGAGTVEFRYEDYLVKVQSDGWIRVFAPANTDSPNEK